MLAGSWKLMKGQMGHVVAGKTLVLIGVQATRSSDASMTLVWPQWPSITVNSMAPLAAIRGRPMVGLETVEIRTARMFVCWNSSGISALPHLGAMATPLIRNPSAELLAV